MSHQVFVDKMLSELSTPMVFLKESSFVFASNGRRWHWCLCSRGALTASLFARSKQEHLAQTKTPYSNDNHAQTRTSNPERGHPAQTRTSCPNKDTLLKRQPRSNEDILPKQGHPARTRTSRTNEDIQPEQGHHAQTRTSQPEQGHQPERSGLENFC